MYTTKLFLLLLSIICVLCNNNVCNFNDVQCTTNAARKDNKILVPGIPGKVQSSDPLIRDKIVVDLPEIKYKLTNVKVYGIMKCEVALLRLYQNGHSFDYRLICPHIRIEGDCEVDGKINNIYIKNKGKCKTDAKNYHIKCIGKIKTHKASDGKEYIRILSWDVKVESEGKLSYSIQDQFDNAASALKYLHENTKSLGDIVSPPTIKSIMDDYLSNINDYLKITPLDMALSA